jgi:hypothetical protein
MRHAGSNVRRKEPDRPMRANRQMRASSRRYLKPGSGRLPLYLGGLGFRRGDVIYSGVLAVIAVAGGAARRGPDGLLLVHPSACSTTWAESVSTSLTSSAEALGVVEHGRYRSACAGVSVRVTGLCPYLVDPRRVGPYSWLGSLWHRGGRTRVIRSTRFPGGAGRAWRSRQRLVDPWFVVGRHGRE